MATYCLAAGLATLLAVASSKHVFAENDAKETARCEANAHIPLTVDNPFIAPLSSVSRQVLSGSQVDPNAPPIYRLPSLDDEVAVASPDDDSSDSAESEASAPEQAAAGNSGLSVDTAEQAADTLPRDSVDASTDQGTPTPELRPAAPGPAPTPPDQRAVAPNDDILPIPAAPESGEPEVPTQQPRSSASFSSNSAEMIPYMPVAAGLSAQLLPSVQRAYALAQRGSLYAAQTEFIQILRRIAQAKDADEGYDDHSRALAAGLRALDEADDFAPTGVQLEAEMNVAVTVSSHRTPVLRNGDTDVLPQEAIAEYHCYAQQQLGRAVAGEQAGSMALHGLGKVYCRLAEETPNDARHQRKAMTMFLAALDAGPQNHLAANEVGVLLARNGHDAEAAAMFKRAIDVAPNSTAYHNLAVAEQKLGQLGQAGADGQYADLLDARERAVGAVSRSKGVEWVSPQELAGVAQPQPLPPSQVANPASTNPMVANRSATPLGPSPASANAQPTHMPNARWW
jgi:tetratricopeptide (TPR) repeat protein